MPLPSHSEPKWGLRLGSALTVDEKTRLRSPLPPLTLWEEGRKGTREQKGSPPLTEHALQPDEAADEAVKVDVHVSVSVAHGYDVIELAVEVESCGGPGEGSELVS